MRALRIATDTFDATTIVSIYQAGESLYEYFDKVCVIYEGRMAYYGSASEAKAYFLEMGYVFSFSFSFLLSSLVISSLCYL